MDKYPRNKYRRLYRTYHSIKARCYNKNEAQYYNYGGRGIVMCDEWLDMECGFERFVDWAYLNGYDDTLTIERVDVNGNYEPNNCKWIPKAEQAKNKRKTIWVDYRGEHIQLSELCDRKNLKYDTIHNRLFRFGWDLDRAIDEPIHTGKTRADLSRERGLNPSTVQARIARLGWTTGQALNTPLLRHYKPRKTV